MQVFCRFLYRVPEGTFPGVIFFLAVLVLLSGGLRGGEENDFMRGDANQDGFISISDALTINNSIFVGGARPKCLDSGDVDDNGKIDIEDTILLISHAFLDAPRFPEPYLVEGADPSPKEGLSCLVYDVVPPETTDDVVRVGDVEGEPGDIVEIPFYVSNTVEVEGYQFVLGFDPEVFTLESPDGPANRGIVTDDETYYSKRDFFFGAATVVDGDKILIGIQPAYLNVPGVRCSDPRAAIAITECNRPVPLAPGEDQLVFKIRGRINPSAPAGVNMVFDTSPGREGYGPLELHNELTHRGQAIFFGTRPRSLDGVLKIAPDITIFRGDANNDGALDQSDGIFLLIYLFLSGEAPECPDAADANDNGRLDIGDPIVILQTVFRGRSLIAPPYPEKGPDVTADDLGNCVSRSE